MPRTLTKAPNLKLVFRDTLRGAVLETTRQVPKTHLKRGILLNNNVKDDWRIVPPSLEDFCANYIKESLYPVQLGFGEACVGTIPYKWSRKYDEAHAFWGKGSGKDRTLAKIVAYVIAKLLCLNNPQKFLRENYQCSIGDGDNIDIVNVSINARQAQNVFFKKFKQIITSTIDPVTGENWFKAMGVDLREGYGIQNTEVRFPSNITAHSLNSETYTGEGLSPLFVTLDEFGAFEVEKAFTLLDALRDSATSRFGTCAKIVVISYKYQDNDAMDVLYSREKKNERVYSSRAATWEVNLMRKKKDFAAAYRRNPEKAKRTYECKGESSDVGFVSKRYMLRSLFDENGNNPVSGDLITVTSDDLTDLKFKKSFHGDPGKSYCVHVDLAKGRIADGYDATGFTLAHPEMMMPTLDKRLMKDLAREGLRISKEIDESGGQKKGVVLDLMLQITAPEKGEVQFSAIRRFIINRLIQELGFNIVLVTYDGWQSVESMQELNAHGVTAQLLSVDRNSADIFGNWKEMLYQQLLRGYYHAIANREASDLITLPNGKVDHPEKSLIRSVQEGFEHGSSDVIQSIVAATWNAVNEIGIGCSVNFG